MLRENRSFRESRSKTIDKSFEQTDTEDKASVATIDNSEKRGSITQKRWTSSDNSSRTHSRKIKTNSEDTETESPNVRSSDRTEEYAQGKARHSDVHENKERIALQSRKKRRKKRSKLSESRRLGGSYHIRTTDDDRADSRSSAKRYSENSLKLNKSQKRKKNLSRGKEIFLYVVQSKLNKVLTREFNSMKICNLHSQTVFLLVCFILNYLIKSRKYLKIAKRERERDSKYATFLDNVRSEKIVKIKKGFVQTHFYLI